MKFTYIKLNSYDDTIEIPDPIKGKIVIRFESIPKEPDLFVGATVRMINEMMQEGAEFIYMIKNNNDKIAILRLSFRKKWWIF